MNREILKNRTKQLAHRCVKAATALPNSKLGNHVSLQLIRASSSVAANYRAVCVAHSTQAFSAKLSIVIEEVDECDFWLEFALDEKMFKQSQVEELRAEAKELCSIFIAARKTIQTKAKKQKEQ